MEDTFVGKDIAFELLSMGGGYGRDASLGLIRDRLLNITKDQWNQLSLCEICDQEYERPFSSVFADSYGYTYDEDGDPVVDRLRYLDYRYLRFFYHPFEDKFFLISGWKDPSWINAKSMRVGLNADDRDSREQIFGKNAIDVQQKSLFQLLTDEVCPALPRETSSS